MAARTITNSSLASRSAVVAAVVLTVSAMSLARDVLIPITLAILVNFMLQPLVARLHKWGCSRVLAVSAVLSATLSASVILFFLITVQVTGVIDNLPEFTRRARQKLEVVSVPVLRLAGRASRSVETLAVAPTSVPADLETGVPAKVEVVDHSFPSSKLAAALGAFATPIATLAIVLVLTGAMLLQGADLRDRIMRLFGDSRIWTTRKALDDAASRVSRYLLVQSALNAGHAVVIGIALGIIGVPNALLWGLMWGLLRFLPFVGPWLGALLPIVTSFGYFDEWGPTVLTICAFITVELVSNFVLEPWLYGAGTGLSPLAILACVIFWAWLWGWVGLLLAVPLTVCLAVLGEYVEPLEFLHVLLSDQPRLRSSARLYERLLTNHADEAAALVAEELKNGSVAQVCENVLIPTLVHLDNDRRGGVLADADIPRLHAVMTRIVDELPTPGGEAPRSARWTALCVPARDQADVLCAKMLKNLCAAEGIQLEVADDGLLANEKAELIVERIPDVAIISSLTPARAGYARHILRRTAKRNADVEIVNGVWARPDDDAESMREYAEFSRTVMVRSFSDAIDAIRFASRPQVSTASVAQEQRTTPQDASAVRPVIPQAV